MFGIPISELKEKIIYDEIERLESENKMLRSSVKILVCLVVFEFIVFSIMLFVLYFI